MNANELIKALAKLHGVGEARAIVNMIMEERFGLSQADVLLGKDTAFPEEKRKELEKIAHRLLSGEPVQHVLGYSYFCGHRFNVSRDVLIPRPETENLAGLVIDELSAAGHQSPIRILDLCTGSGCIAISLALAFPEAKVVGVDISEEALAIARDNAEILKAKNIEFLRHNVLAGAMQLGACFGDSEEVDVITANPPYVRYSETKEMSDAVLKYEPPLALFVSNEDPLLFYRAIALTGLSILAPKGLIAVEINTYLCEETRQIFSDAGYKDVELHDDQFSRPRIIIARR